MDSKTMHALQILTVFGRMCSPGKRRDDYDGRVQHQQPPATAAGPHVKMVRVMVVTVPVRPVVVLMVRSGGERYAGPPAIAEPLQSPAQVTETMFAAIFRFVSAVRRNVSPSDRVVPVRGDAVRDTTRVRGRVTSNVAVVISAGGRVVRAMCPEFCPNSPVCAVFRTIA